jgi:hypothetical protein
MHGVAAQPRGDIAERQRFGEVHQVAQMAPERPNHRPRDIRLVAVQILERGPRQKD